MLGWRWHHLVNLLESTGIISAMLLLMMWIGWLLGGVDTLYVMLGTGTLFIIVGYPANYGNVKIV